MKTLSIFLLLLISTVGLSLSDIPGYNKVSKFSIENDVIRITHFHDWSDATKEARYLMMITHQNPFLKSNTYAYLECVKKAGGQVVFKKPVPALTKLFFSSDGKFVIGLSIIKLWNPFQLVIFDTSGNLIYAKHIAAGEARLSFQEYLEFKEIFPLQNELLELLERINFIDRSVYIDFQSANMPIWLGNGWYYLMNHVTHSHLSGNFQETFTSWIYWYKEPDPAIKCVIDQGKLVELSLLDPIGQRFAITLF